MKQIDGMKGDSTGELSFPSGWFMAVALHNTRGLETPGYETVGNKLPQDALNPAHGSLLRVNSHSQETFFITPGV